MSTMTSSMRGLSYTSRADKSCLLLAACACQDSRVSDATHHVIVRAIISWHEASTTSSMRSLSYTSCADKSCLLLAACACQHSSIVRS